MRNRPLAIYFLLLITLCTAVIGGARVLGRQGAYLAQVYMLTPALAAVITRLFFYKPGFSDAGLRLGRLMDYLKFAPDFSKSSASARAPVPVARTAARGVGGQ